MKNVSRKQMIEYFTNNGWRYDDAYGSLYKYYKEDNAYFFYCNAPTTKEAYLIAKMRDESDV